MRELRDGETKKKGYAGSYQYFDELGRNTFYRAANGSWYDKKWIRLPNGQDKEIEVVSSTGYWRKHYYDNFTGALIREIDSNGNTNLLDKRRTWNKQESEVSLENTKGRVIISNESNNPNSLF